MIDLKTICKLTTIDIGKFFPVYIWDMRYYFVLYFLFKKTIIPKLFNNLFYINLNYFN